MVYVERGGGRGQDGEAAEVEQKGQVYESQHQNGEKYYVEEQSFPAAEELPGLSQEQLVHGEGLSV